MWIRVKLGTMTIIQKSVVPLLFLSVLGLSVTAYARNMVWRDEVTLWEDTVKKSPNKDRAVYNFHDSSGRAYVKYGRFDEALKEFHTAIKINPYFADAHNNLGLIYLKKGGVSEAFKEIQIALTLEPRSANIHDSLGQVYAAQNRIDEAMKAFQTALTLDSNCAEARDNLENLYRLTKGKEKNN